MPLLPKAGPRKVQLDGDVGDAGRPADVTIKTQYGCFRVHQEVPGGDAWMHLETRPAFEVALIDPEKMTVIIVRKGDVTKIPGGYLGDDPDSHNGEMEKRILDDLGILVSHRSFVSLGTVSGHPEIVTPIKLFFCTKWERAVRPRLEPIALPLWEAFGWAADQRISNDTGIVLLLRLAYRLQHGLQLVS